MSFEPGPALRQLDRLKAQRGKEGFAGRPIVTLSYAQSIDGSLTAQRGAPLSLSGPESLRVTHQLRAAHDAILVGIGTVISDDPRMNVRLVEGEDPQPVVLDGRLRFPPGARLLASGLSPWIMTARKENASRKKELETAGARVIHLPADTAGYIDLEHALCCLFDLGIRSVMVEGGARVIQNFFIRRMADFVVITITPVFVGGLKAVETLLEARLPDAQESPGQYLSRLPHIQSPQYEFMGKDLVISGEISWMDETLS